VRASDSGIYHSGEVPQVAQGGVRRRAKGDLLQVPEKATQGSEADHQAVVLRSLKGVRPSLTDSSYTDLQTNIIIETSTADMYFYMNNVVLHKVRS